MNKYEDLEEEVLKKEAKKEKHWESRMKVSGRSVLNLLKIFSKKAKKR